MTNMDSPKPCTPQKLNSSKSSTPKRVSFGSNGDATVETQIFDYNFKDNLEISLNQPHNQPHSQSNKDSDISNEPHVMALVESPDMQLNTNSNATPPVVTSGGETSPSMDPNHASPVLRKKPILVTSRTDSYENPFQHDGELSKKADFIVKNSTISRTEVCIADPDKTKIPTTIGADTHDDDYDPTPVPVQDEMLVQSAAPVAHAAPSSGAGDMVDGPTRPNDIGVKANGALDDSKAPGVVTPQSVSVEVGTADASKPEVQQAEQVKVPKKRGKCCVIQ